MKILVDALPLKGLQTGIGRYVRTLYQAMEAAGSKSTQVEIGYFDGFAVRRTMPAAADPGRWTALTGALWKLPDAAVTALRVFHWLNYERRLRAACRKERFHVYHETSFFPAALRGVPTVFSLFDFSLDHYAHTHPRERVWFHRLLFPRRIGYAAQIVTLSRFVKDEAVQRLGIEEARLTVIPPAPDPVFGPRPQATVEAACRRFGIRGPYLLFVGSLEPRKNLHTVLEAWNRLGRPVGLVLAGWSAWGKKDWLPQADPGGHETPVRTGYVDDDTLAALYSGARALVYPSLYEGFGLPIVEAMACGCPVICSHTSSMPEAAGDAAHLVDPRDPDALAAALDRVLTDETYRETLIRRGFRHAATFSWENTARAALDIFRCTAERFSWPSSS